MSMEYDEQTLKKLQQTELEILKDFIYICEKYNLTYFALAGTGIGALRHKGFIPWDDDIDVGLLRNDYDVFLQKAAEEFPEKYKIVNAETCTNFPLMTTRWTKAGTQFVEEALKNIQCDLGIFLDIYCFDNISDDEKLMQKQAKTAWFWSKLMILRSIAFPVLAFTGVKAKLIHFICAVVHYLMVIFRISKKWLYGKCRKASCRYNQTETKRAAFLCDTSPYTNTVDKQDLEPLLELDFEDIKLKFPNSLHKMLTFMYGDYMQLPPEEKRKNHYPYRLDFGNEDKTIHVG